MLSTAIYATLFIVLSMLYVVMWPVFLRLGLQWAKVSDVTTRRIVFATASVIAINVVAAMAFRFFTPPPESRTIILFGVVGLAANVLAPCLIISWVFGIRIHRSFQAWLPTVLSSGAFLLFVILLLRPYLYEAFRTSSNSMAPTLLGEHWRSTCPECGQPNFCTPVPEHFTPPRSPRMICENFHVHLIDEVAHDVFPADRFLVAKFLAAKRWDLVVFQYPDDRSITYVSRLVGLPGETIHIEGGAVWVNGGKPTPPDSLRGGKYLSELTDWHNDLWGSKDRPAVLGPDEYFVLGDFSAVSNDSRIWKQGAPGHNPFAVPESHLQGVVTHIYWPPERWRILR